MPSTLEHLKTLGLSYGASPDAIKKAYRDLAKKHHPDVGGDAATFQRITAAHTALVKLGTAPRSSSHDEPYHDPFNDFFAKRDGSTFKS